MTTDPPNYTIFDALLDWGSTNAHQIHEAHLSKGGWEGWAQEEMRFLFNAGREDNCYQNNARQAADIVLTPYTSGAAAFAQPYVDEECVVIELKCESYWNAQKFRGEVRKDMQKVNSGVFKGPLLRGGCNVYCVALAMTDEGAYEMESLGLELFEGGSGAAPFQVWWCMRRFEPEYDSEDEDEEDDEEDDGDGEDDDEMQEDEVDFDVEEASSDEDGYQNAYGNGYHDGHNGGWDYNYS
ncbi:hypothetical protein ABOM_004337 [Aspergillus bombycis]|uniref:Uncharacterized protein n=1 Tax=Aspergillus bombycis TaxID=109264 RepID=A0A1F8A7F7_9EURO|nr:hypothetical protein ABOM_004337 [Aspergillus bombycis]OGM47654.1 hypothetical protein ABOM_004337 [Aspergillus bombycis]